MLQFEVLINQDPEVLLLNNSSTGSPVSPTWKIKLPSGDTVYSIPAVAAYQTLNADSFGIVCVDCLTNPLPDGIYDITLQEGAGEPYTTTQQFHLRTNAFRKNYDSLLVRIEYSEYTVKEDQIIKDACNDIDMMLEAARAHALLGNVQTAKSIFTKVEKVMTRLVKQTTDC